LREPRAGVSMRSSLGQNVGGTEVTSALLDRDMRICQRNGNTMMNPPMDRTTWAQTLLPCRPPWERRALADVRVALDVVRASLKAEPPPLDPELDRGQESDDQHQQDGDRRPGPLVVADERFAVEQRDHRLGIA